MAALLPLLVAAAEPDPFNTAARHASSPGARLLRAPCQPLAAGTPLQLIQAVEQALCHNPRTHQAWASARAQAAQVGVAQSAYLPSVSASAGRSRVTSEAANGVAGSTRNQTSGALSLSYLLYDFGERSATLENARQLMTALNASEDATLQEVFLNTVQAYYQALAAEAAVLAARESERASLESQKAAETRYRVGSGTPADQLQAQTAAAQATLSRIQAEGAVRTALGSLANAMGLDAHQTPTIALPVELAPETGFEANIAELIATAKQRRPDLAAAEAQVRAAEAGIDATRASGRPTLSLTAGKTYLDSGLPDAARGQTVGITLNIPLFSGFNTTYKIRAAEAQRDLRAAQRDQLSKQVSLDVWRSYYALQTSTESVRATRALLASAEQSEKVAAGRYRAGVGGILDLLNAQSALASARLQHIQSRYNWHLAKAALAQAMGQLDFDQFNRQTQP